MKQKEWKAELKMEVQICNDEVEILQSTADEVI